MTPDQNTQPGRIAFGDFLAYLQARGFIIGVDQHLRMQQLLARIEGDCAPDRLKHLLAPLFATSRERQQAFYCAFDEYFAIFGTPATINEKAKLHVPEPQPVSNAPRPRMRVALLAALILLSLSIAIWKFRPGGKPLPPIDPTPSPTTTAINAQPTSSPATFFEPATIIENLNIKPAAAHTPTPKSNWVLENARLLRLMSFLSPLVLFGLWWLWRYWRQRPIVEMAFGRRPPFTWPLELEPEEWRLDRSRHFYLAARGMQRRQHEESYYLDLPRTIEATIAKQGYPNFRYRLGSRVPEYLVLIDRSAPHDHQTRLFDQMVQALEREGVFVVRCFYDDDPRICRLAENGQNLYLSELRRRYPTHRLLLFGDGARLLDQFSGELNEWATMLTEWADPAILTPVGLLAWGRRERVLMEHFTLLPATQAGLVELAERYELPFRNGLPLDDEAALAIAPPDIEYGVTVADLRRYLGPQAFQWLCACAMYPELQWDLTLKLGQQIVPAGETSRLDEAALWRLLRLPWFREGRIPEKIRFELVRALDPAMAKRIRKFLIEILERNPAEEGTFAADERRLDIAVQKAWLAESDRRERKEAVEPIKALPPGEWQRDYTLVRLMDERPTTILGLILPARLRKQFYPEGLSPFGIRWQAALLIALLAALILGGSAETLIRYRGSHQPGPVVTPGTGGQLEVRLELVGIPGGSFLMGSPAGELGRDEYEGPQHTVTLQPFYMGKYEITQAQWNQVTALPKVKIDLNSDPSFFKGDDLPVENISWEDAQEFCERLSIYTHRQYRLPTEAEWEYACRAGTTTPFAFGFSLSSQQANFDGNSPYGGAQKSEYRGKSTTVGTFQSNAWALCDMHGNVWEWCQDGWRESYNGAPTNGSAWLSGDDAILRLLRGGAWYGNGSLCRSANRNANPPGVRCNNIGFRVVVGMRIP